MLEIVGEALNRASRSEPDVTTTVPNLRLYVDLRNQITHGYDSVDYSIVWRVATEEIPALQGELNEILKSAPPLAN